MIGPTCVDPIQEDDPTQELTATHACLYKISWRMDDKDCSAYDDKTVRTTAISAMVSSLRPPSVLDVERAKAGSTRGVDGVRNSPRHYIHAL